MKAKKTRSYTQFCGIFSNFEKISNGVREKWKKPSKIRNQYP